MDLQLQDTVAFVAGSSRGIGLAIARAFLREGAKVVITGRDGNSVDQAAAQLRGDFTDRILPMQGDFTDRATIAAALAETLKRWGRVDTVVANVGSGRMEKGPAYSDEQWSQALEQNLLGSARLAEEALPAMQERKSGCILFTSSIAGVEAIAAPAPYCSAKAAVIAYAKRLARQVAKDGVRVNCIAPGNILFPGGSWEKRLHDDKAGTEAYIEKNVPLGRFGTPEEIADLAVFLASPKSSFTTGTCVVCDGGQTYSL